MIDFNRKMSNEVKLRFQNKIRHIMNKHDIPEKINQIIEELTE